MIRARSQLSGRFLAGLSSLLALGATGCIVSTETEAIDDETVDDLAEGVTATITIQAEDYRSGGEGVGYHDTTSGNEGAVYRADNVDLQAATDSGGGYDVGWVAAGEWLSYAFSAPAAASYAFTARVASHTAGTKNLHLEVDGVALPAVGYADAAGWQSWQTISLGSANVTAGAHTLRLVAESGNVNFNWIAGTYTVPVAGLSCPAAFPTEVFRDDFAGNALDQSKWGVVQQNSGGSGAFTQLTKMLSSNVTVSGGRLHVASRRHCTDPYPNGSAEHPAKCAGTNYYSGGWLKGDNYFAPGKGLMMFHAKMPTPVQGIFPALWARNQHGDQYYGEADLIETWWDMSGKGNSANNTRFFSSTTHMVTDAWYHTNGNDSPQYDNLVGPFHVWEVEWDANSNPAAIRYYYRDAPGASRVLLRTVTYQSAGLSGHVTAAQFKTIVSDGWRPYIDFAVQPDSAYHVGPDAAASYDPPDLEVESVVICKP